MPKEIILRAADTEPLTFTVAAEGVSNLDDVSSVAFYARKTDATSNHVDGATATVSDSANQEVTFDPASNKSGGGDAFDAIGTYRCYALVTWSDGDVTRHPADDWLTVRVTENYE